MNRTYTALDAANERIVAERYLEVKIQWLLDFGFWPLVFEVDFGVETLQPHSCERVLTQKPKAKSRRPKTYFPAIRS